jgi:hypothetical protein
MASASLLVAGGAGAVTAMLTSPPGSCGFCGRVVPGAVRSRVRL